MFDEGTDVQARKDPETAALFRRLAKLPAERRFFRVLDDAHAAAYAEAGDTLVVTFERTESILATGEAPMPLGHWLSDTFGWSFLTILVTGSTWARSDAVYALFDDLIDRGLFDGFERVLFYGAGTQAHAACAFAVAAPGADVIAISPQATLSPDRAGFDHRFGPARRMDFTSRYGYAPAMLEAAGTVHILYDPRIDEDAAHAAQFNAPHIRLHRLRHFGENPEQMLAQMEALPRIFELWDDGRLDAGTLARVLRARRGSRSYLMRLFDQTQEAEKTLRGAILCNFAWRELGAPRFRRRRDELLDELRADGIPVPAALEDGPEDA